jgi:hypothetical protein
LETDGSLLVHLHARAAVELAPAEVATVHSLEQASAVLLRHTPCSQASTLPALEASEASLDLDGLLRLHLELVVPRRLGVPARLVAPEARLHEGGRRLLLSGLHLGVEVRPSLHTAEPTLDPSGAILLEGTQLLPARPRLAAALEASEGSLDNSGLLNVHELQTPLVSQTSPLVPSEGGLDGDSLHTFHLEELAALGPGQVAAAVAFVPAMTIHEAGLR